jgi:uncharacterized protein
MKNKNNKVLRLFRFIYLKFFRINDTPQKIALGAGIGVALGILPGTGPVAAVFIAFILRANRAAAFLGSLLTNTWTSLLSLALSIKIGSSIMGLSWQETQGNWAQFLKNFKFATLFRLASLEIITPLVVGYLVIALCLGIIGYLATLILVLKIKKRKSLKQL